MSRINQSLIAAALAVLVNAVVVVSLAGTPDTTLNRRSLVVHYNDLSLDRAADVTRLYRRDDLPEEQCWLRAPGWSLAYR